MRYSTKVISVGIGILLMTSLSACRRGPDDATLAANVKTQITADATLAKSVINVTAKDGVVTLTGNANSDAEKAKAEQIAKGVDGVKSVVNSLTVKPAVVNATPPPVTEDTKLKSDITANLTKYSITGVTVAVASGEVTLTGDIPRAKLQDAMKAANEAHPKKVVNKLNIK
jgi:hyperosmotically inducible protein